MGSATDHRPSFDPALPLAPTENPVDDLGDRPHPNGPGRRWRRPSRPQTGLWRRPDFLRLWAAQSVSQLGSQVTLLALPLIAALTLDASAFEVGLLAAAWSAPFLLVGLFAGVWVDRLPRRPVLIATDVGRAVLIAIIPVAHVFGLLGMPLLYVVAFLTGILSLFFDVAYLSYLPVMVTKDELLDGNGKLQSSESAAQIFGPGLAGGLIRFVSAPGALVIDACSFLASAFFISRIRTPEPPPAPSADRPHVWREIGEGLGLVRRQPLLRALVACSATTNFFAHVFFAVYVLYMTRDLGLGAGAVGLVFATGGVGALIGALLAGPTARRFGPGPTLLAAQLLFGLAGLVIPLAVLFPRLALAMVVASEFFQWLTILVYDVNAVSLRQAVTPHRLLGRVNATHRFLAWGMRPLGSLVGGLLGGLIGLPLTLAAGEAGMFVAFVWLLRSPLPGLRSAPALAEDEAHPGSPASEQRGAP